MPSFETDRGYAWVVVAATFVCLGVIFGVAYSFAAFFQPFASEFGAQRADVSLVFGLSGLLYFVLGAGTGMLADRLGPRLVCAAGMVVIAAGLAATSVANSLALVYLAYGVGIGLGVALVYTPSIGCVQPWFTQRRGLAAGLASAGIGAGTVAVPLVAAAAIAAVDWRTALRLLALGVLVLGLGAALLLRRAPLTPGRGGVLPGVTLREALRSREVWWLYAGGVLASPAMFVPFAHVSAAARDLGIDGPRAVGLVGLIGVGSLTGRFAIGWLADRAGRALTLAIAQASLGLAFLVWHAAGGYAGMAIFALWMGVSYGGIVSLMPALCMDLFGARAVSGIIGTLYTGAAAGNLLGPWAAGAVYDVTRSYSLVAWACLALAGLATLATTRIVGRRGPAH